MNALFEHVCFGNSVGAYIVALSMIIVGLIVVRLFRSIVVNGLKTWAEKTTTSLDDFLVGVIQRIIMPLAYFGIVYLGVTSLVLDAIISTVVSVTGFAVLTIAGARLSIALVNYGSAVYCRKRQPDNVLSRSLAGILRVVNFVIWALALILFFDNIGFEVSAVLAGLGIGGVAVALAAQAILGDLFSYFSILFDRPFELGDFVIVDDYLGSIENIGIKTTRIRSLSGEQLVFSNSDLTSSRLRNYKRMVERRVLFTLGVTYQTPVEKLKKIPGMIEKIVAHVDQTRFDRAHFSSYGDFNLVIEVVYYVLTADYNQYMDIQQAINLAIKEAFENEAIEFAYPTQTLFVEKTA